VMEAELSECFRPTWPFNSSAIYPVV
jgi:hypothetical protein